MTVNLSALAGAGQQFFDNSGIPLSGGKLYSYAAGTTTPQATYTSVTGLTAHTNPIVLNSAGRVATGEIWVTAGQNYKFVLETSTNVMLVTWDNITGINGTGIATNANLVEYDPPFTGAVTSGYNVEEKLSQTVSVKDFGAVGDGVTDDTAAINAALAASNSVFIPSGLYKVTTINLNQSTGINSTGGNLIYGAGTDDAGTQLIGTAGYTMFKAWGDAPPAFSKSLSFTLKEMRLFGSGNTGIGIDLYSCINCRIENVYVTGFDYGLKARTTIGISFVGTTSFVGNNVGIKVPLLSSAGVAATENLCANLWSFDYCDVRQNAKAGASIGCGQNWTINNALAEANGVAFYLVENINYFRCDNLYLETMLPNATSPVNRLGNPQAWLAYMGRDEDGVSGSVPSSNFIFENVNTDFDNAAFYFTAVSDVRCFVSSGRGNFELGPNVSKFTSNSVASEPATMLLVPGQGRSVANGIFKSYSANLLPNGNFKFSRAPQPSASTNASAVVTTLTLNGQPVQCLLLTNSSAGTTMTYEWEINVGTDFNTGEAVVITMHGIADAAISSVTLSMLNSAGASIASQTKTTGIAGIWHVLIASATIPAGDTRFSIRVTTVHPSGATNDGYYIEEIMCTPRSTPVTQYPSVLDYTIGNTFSGVTSTADGSLWKFIVTSPYSAYYALISSRMSGTTVIPKVSLHYSGATLTVYSDTQNITVDGMFIPLNGQLI